MTSEDLRTMSYGQRLALAMNPQVRAQDVIQPSAQLQLTQDGQGKAEADVVGGALPAVVGEQHLVFSLNDQEIAVKAELVQGVERLMNVTPVPNIASWVRGVVNLRGSIASVVDLRAFLDLEPSTYGPRTRLLSLQYNEMVICLIVDSISEMLPIPNEAISGAGARQSTIPQWIAPYATASALLGKRMIVLLDVARLLFSDKMQRY